jgi:polyhydroxybutyrate depolymerase
MLAHGSAGECWMWPGSQPSIAPGDYNWSVNSDGLVRTFLVHIPPNVEARPALIVVFHGGGGTSLRMANKTHMNKVSDVGNFIAVYPQGVRGEWNFGPQSRSSANDVAFIRRMLEYLTAQLNIDQKRIYMAGFSQGGFMTQRLTYEMPEKIAAATIVSSAEPVGLMQMFGPGHLPLPMIIILGTADPRVKFTGGLDLHGIDLLSGPATVDSWVAADRCGAPTHTWLPNKCTTDDSRPELIYYPGMCNNDVAFYKIWGGGHEWPGGTPGYLRDIGNQNNDFSASQAIWAFDSVHPKRR